ncbi:MAG: hypothetical protein U1F06_02085 [Steroidobacteraceae bacterium]
MNETARGSFARQEMISEDRIGGRAGARGADAAEQPLAEGCQRAEGRREAGRQARGAEDDEADAEDPAAGSACRPAARPAAARVQRGGGEADDRARLDVVELQVAFDVDQQADAGVAEQRSSISANRPRRTRGATPWVG